MPNNDFEEDLNEEQEFARYLDTVYPDINELKSYTIERKNDNEHQHRGIDIIVSNHKHIIYVDEKAQLYYKNSNLPTFSFELSYIKNNQLKEGWLFDKRKLTHKYFLFTCIEKNNTFSNFRLVSVSRKKLLNYLTENGFTQNIAVKYDDEFRSNTEAYNNQKIIIKELDSSFATLRCSFDLKEQPINLIIYLNKLIHLGIAKELRSCNLNKSQKT